MPAQSKAQQRFMGMVHAAQKGELDNPSKEVEKVAKDMDKSDAKDFASTKHKGLPNHVKQEILKRVKEYAIIGDKHVKYPSDNEPLRSDDEMDIQEDRIPQNFNVGVASDYHTKVATTPREDYDDTNFDKEDSGQPDLKEGSADELEMLKLTVKAMKSMPGSPRQKEYIKQLNALRIKNGLKPLAETYIKEWGSNLDNSFIINQNAKLDGTPEDIDAIDRDMKSIDEIILTEKQFKGLEGIPSTTSLEKISKDQKLKIIKGVGNIIDFKVPKGVSRNFWQVIGTGKIKKNLSGETYLEGKVINSPMFKSLDALIDGVLWKSMEERRRFNEGVVSESWSVKDGSVLSNGKLIGYYDFDRDSDSFWVDDVKKGKGQLSFDTKKEVEDYFKKNEKDAVKHLQKLREATTPSDIIKDLDKAKNDLLKKVDVLISKKKKLYSDVDIESPMSADEKQLDKDIQSIFSQIQSLIQQKRKIQKESINEEQPHQKEMVDGIVDMLNQVEDLDNRKEMAIDQLKNFKEENISVNPKEFLQRCGLTESKFNGNLSGDAAEYIAKELSHYVKGIIDQPNRKVTYLHLKDKSYKGKVIKTLKDIYGLDAKDGGILFSPSPTVVFSNNEILESKINESPESLQKELEYQLKWAYTHFKQNPKDSRYEKVVKDTIDKIKQLKKTGRLEGVNELPETFNQIRVLSKEEFQNEAMNPREDALLKTFKNIVDTHSSLKVKDGGRTILVDVQSANAVLKLYDALSDSNKKSLLKMPVGKMIKMAWHVLGKK